jgi:hypothetical protein
MQEKEKQIIKSFYKLLQIAYWQNNNHCLGKYTEFKCFNFNGPDIPCKHIIYCGSCKKIEKLIEGL